MSSNVGLAIQCVGIMLLALLSLSMRGSIKSPSLKCWTAAWISLSLALVSLFAGFHIAPEQKLFYSIYFFGEYAFGLMFISGCRYHASGVRPTRRCASMLIPAALLPSCCLFSQPTSTIYLRCKRPSWRFCLRLRSSSCVRRCDERKPVTACAS